MDEYLLDIDDWIKRFPLDSMPRERWYPGRVNSPIDLAIIEQVRRRAAEVGDLGPTVPVDVFVLARGEPARRDVTKVGGLPYRPRGPSWPELEDGQPMNFIAQVGFCGSKDLMGELPGDVHLMFCRSEGLYTGDPPFFYFEWQPRELTDLVGANDVPQSTWWRFPPCYGVRCRTVDFEDEDRVSRYVQRVAGRVAYSGGRTDLNYRRKMARLSGTKIGGLPYWPTPENVPHLQWPIVRLLFSLSMIRPWIEEPFPWVGYTEPEGEPEWVFEEGPDDVFGYRDGCDLNFFIDGKGRIDWEAQFS